MDIVSETGVFAPPATYEDWLKCFDFLKSAPSFDGETAAVIAKGSFENFSGSAYIAGRFCRELTETINEMLNKRVLKFIKDLNLLISFNELADIVSLFIKLRNEVKKCLFFTDLGFLDEAVKKDMEQSVKTQTEKFWDDTVAFLQKQSQEYSNGLLEDALFLIHRINLFEKPEKSEKFEKFEKSEELSPAVNK